MQWLIILLLLLGSVITLTGPRRTQPSARIVCGILLLFAILIPAWHLHRSWNPSLNRGFNDRETMLTVEGRILGEYIAGNFAGGNVVILPPLFPPVQAAPGLKAMMKIAKGTIQFVQPVLPPSIMSRGTIDRNELRAFIHSHYSGANAVVVSSHHGFYLREWMALKSDTAPALIMMLHPDPESLGNLIQHQIVHATTFYTPPPDARARILEHGMRRMTSTDALKFFTVATRDNYASLTGDN